MCFISFLLYDKYLMAASFVWWSFFPLFIPPWKCWSAFEWNFRLHFLELLIFWQFLLIPVSLGIDFSAFLSLSHGQYSVVWGSILWSRSSSWLCGGSAGRTLQDELCSCPALVLGLAGVLCPWCHGHHVICAGQACAGLLWSRCWKLLMFNRCLGSLFTCTCQV